MWGLVLLLCTLLGSTQAFSERAFDAPAFYTSNKDYFEYVSSQINPITSSVELTTSTSSLRAAALWYKTPVLTRGLYSKFSFRISSAGNDSAHGITFLIQNDEAGSISLGGVSAGMGYASPTPSDLTGIKNSIAIEFDCIGNPEMNDPGQAHLSIHTRNSESNSANEQLASLFSFRQLADFCAGQTTTVEITYEPGFLTILMSPIISPIVERFSISVEDRLNLLPGGKSYIGFTASTGRQAASQEILSWSYKFLGVANAEKSLCGGPSEAVAGVSSTFWFQLKDQYDNFYPFGGVGLTFQLIGPGQTTSSVRDLGNGNYEVTTTATVTGSYSVDARLEGVSFQCSSSLSVSLSPGPLSGPKTVPLTTLPQQVSAGAMSSLRIQAYDTYGNIIQHGGESVTASISPQDTRDIISIEDGNDGTYTIYFTTFKAVPFALSVYGNGQQIKSSPFSMVTQPAAADPSSSYVESWLSLYTAGEAQEFHVLVLDQYQNLLLRGGDRVDVIPSPAVQVTSTVTDLGTGIYLVSLEHKKTGKYDVEIKVNNVPIKQSPFSLSVQPAALDISNTIAVGQDLTSGFAGVQSEFIILGMDRFNNSLGGTLPVKFVVELFGRTTNLSASAINRDDGSALVTYTPIVAGYFETSITSEGQHISNSPASTLIKPARESPANTYIAALSTPWEKVEVMKEVWLLVQIVDEYGNLLSVGGQDLTANITSLKRTPVSLSLVDNKNGTFTIGFVPEKNQHGEYTFEIKLNDEHIKDSPISLSIIPIDNTNMIVLAVCLPIVFLSVVAIAGLIVRRWLQKRKGQGYQLVSTSEPATN